MNVSCLLLAFASAVTFKLGFEAWRRTSSKMVRLNTFVGTSGLALAAYGVTRPGGAGSAATIAFFVAMLFAGCAIGLFFRSRTDRDLRVSSTLLFAVAATSLLAAATVWYWP